MPLTSIQRQVVAVLQPFRAHHNYVGGGAALNQTWPRLSDDLDIFQDTREGLVVRVRPELDALQAAGFQVEIVVQSNETVEAIARRYGFDTKIQWMDDEETSRRFFAAIPDDELGFRLHQADLAVNKVLCASRRRSAPRDAVDLATIAERYAPLGPLVWACSAKDPRVGPLQTIANVRANCFGYSEEQISTVRMEDGSAASRELVRETLDSKLAEARDYCEDVAPAGYEQFLFVDEEDRPTEATERSLGDAVARAIPLKVFGPEPQL